MRDVSIAGLRVTLNDGAPPRETPLVVLLHGYDGFARDLSPFAASFGLPLLFAFPEGPLAAHRGPRGGRAWWSIDEEGRAAAMERGEPRDLSDIDPPGLPAARKRLEGVLDALTETYRPPCVIVGGFSQGAMLSCDLALSSERALGGVVQLAGARIRKDVWASRYETRRGLPAFIAHGRADPDLSFHAAERLRDDLVRGGLAVTWVPFDGGHEIPLVALRALKRFLVTITTRC